MNVLMINPSGSAGAFIHKLCNALTALGTSVELWTGPMYQRFMRAWYPASYLTRFRFYRFTQWRSWQPGPLRPIWRLLRLAGHCWAVGQLLRRARAFDVVHLHFLSVPVLDALWMSLLRRLAPLAYTVHNLYPHDTERSPGVVRLYRRIYHSCDVLFAHTEETARGLRDEFGVPAERITLIPLGNVCDVVRTELIPTREEIGLEPGAPLVLLLGDIRRNKGLHVLLEAARLLKDRGQSFRVLIAGRHSTGRPDEDINLAASLGLANEVEFRPTFVEEEAIPAYLAAADIVAIPYLVIDQSAGAIWAASYGRPIVASEIGGLASLVRSGAAVGVPPGDARALADAIGRLLTDADLRSRTAQAARRFAEQDLGWDNIARRMTDAYARASRRASPARS